MRATLIRVKRTGLPNPPRITVAPINSSWHHTEGFCASGPARTAGTLHSACVPRQTSTDELGPSHIEPILVISMLMTEFREIVGLHTVGNVFAVAHLSNKCRMSKQSLHNDGRLASSDCHNTCCHDENKNSQCSALNLSHFRKWMLNGSLLQRGS